VALALFAATALTGCLTGKPVTEQLAEGVAQTESAETDVPVVASGPEAPAQQQTAAAAAGPASPLLSAQPQPAPAQAGAIVMQGTGLQATSSSIFSTGGAVSASPVSGGGSSPASLFHSASPPQGPASQPLPVSQALPASQVLPVSQAQPVSQALPLEATDAGYQAAPAGQTPVLAATRKEASLTPETVAGAADLSGPSLSLVGLFAASRKGRGKPSPAPAGKLDKMAKVPGSPQLGPQQAAVLSYAALPGIRARSMFATVDDTAENHDDSSPAVQTASLSGLARLAPSGLLLQTETVETGCFKPQLLNILKSVERHFGKKVLVTSGRRSVAHNIKVGGRPLSRHLTCEAADIQVAGVSKWDVAGFLRQAEGRGGVGTYCNTQSVHIDIGPRRDWNWQCGPRDA
jgi:uncharacterized protein YcbK (DUF882 family)